MVRRFLIALIFCSSFLSAQATSISFSARQDLSTTFQKLTGLAIADFNGDGKPDLAVTDVYAQNVVVYLNDGTGKFGPPIVTTLAIQGIGGLGALVAGDLNEDGKQDLVVAPVGGDQVDVVLLGNGDGTFTQGNTIPGTYGFFHASLTDLNGDHHLDLVAGGNGNVYASLGDGKGNFTPVAVNAPEDVINAFFDLSVGDFNSDKLPDFVTVGYDTSALLFFAGSPGGQFSPAVTSQPANVFSPISITSGDYNGDGKLDVVIGSASIATLFYGNGDGTFQINAGQEVFLPLAYDPSVNTNGTTEPVVASGDMNGDGTIDIVAADNTYDKLSVLLNDGSGTFTQSSPDYQAALDPGSGELRLADLNGDGLPDIIITNYETQKIAIFFSVGPKLTPTVSLASSLQQALVGSAVSVTVQIQGNGSSVPSGTVNLVSGFTAFGQQPLDASGRAAFTLANLPAGQYPLTASYSGDQNYGAASNAIAVTQSITDFQLALTSPSQSVAVGTSATYGVSLSPLFGFSGSVNLTCSGLPAGFSCAAASSSLAGQASTVSLVVSPPASAVALQEATGRPGGKALLVLLGCGGFCLCFRKRRLTLPAIVAIMVLGGVLAGCSGSSSPSKPAPFTGTSTFTIIATATQSAVTVSHQVAATLIVQ